MTHRGTRPAACWLAGAAWVGTVLGAGGASAELTDRAQYLLRCSGCHGADGRGLASSGIPDLREAGLYAGDAVGRAYLVQVPGISQSPLDDAHAARILNWVVLTFSPEHLPAEFQPFTAAEVGRLRADPASDAGARRAVALRAALAGARADGATPEGAGSGSAGAVAPAP